MKGFKIKYPLGINNTVDDMISFRFNTDFLMHAPCMLLVQNEYEECSKHYQQTLSQLPEPSQNSTDKAIEEVCW